MTAPPRRAASVRLVQSCMVRLQWLRAAEMLGEAGVNRALRPEQRRLDTDARTVAQLVDAVDRVDQHEPRIEFADHRRVEMLDHREIELTVPGQLVGVGEAAAQ